VRPIVTFYHFHRRAASIAGDQHNGLIALTPLTGSVIFVQDLKGSAERG